MVTVKGLVLSWIVNKVYFSFSSEQELLVDSVFAWTAGFSFVDWLWDTGVGITNSLYEAFLLHFLQIASLIRNTLWVLGYSYHNKTFIGLVWNKCVIKTFLRLYLLPPWWQTLPPKPIALLYVSSFVSNNFIWVCCLLIPHIILSLSISFNVSPKKQCSTMACIMVHKQLPTHHLVLLSNWFLKVGAPWKNLIQQQVNTGVIIRNEWNIIFKQTS